MDFIPPMAAVSAAAHNPVPVDALATAADSQAVTAAVPDALDPRSIYAFSAQAAEAVMALVRTQSQPLAIAAFNAQHGREPPVPGVVLATAVAATPVVSPETTKTVNAATRNWSEDVRLEHSPFRNVGTDTVVRYDNPRVMAAWHAAFPDIADRKFRGLQIAATNFKEVLSKLAADGVFDENQKNIFLLCNVDRYERFTQDHPGIHVNWIDVDNEDILLFWPKDSSDDASDSR